MTRYIGTSTLFVGLSTDHQTERAMAAQLFVYSSWFTDMDACFAPKEIELENKIVDGALQ